MYKSFYPFLGALGLAATLLLVGNSCSSASSTPDKSRMRIIRQFSGGKVIGEWVAKADDITFYDNRVYFSEDFTKKNGIIFLSGEFQVLTSKVTEAVERATNE